MTDVQNAQPVVSGETLDTLFREARSYNVFEPGNISDATLHALYDLTKMGPTTANSQPQRIVFLRSQQAKERLRDAMSKTNLEKTISAPVVALLAYDLRFFEHFDRMYHVKGARAWYETTPEQINTTALRNASLQGAYFIMAARALGLDAGPMSGFDNAKIDAEFFPDGKWKSNFLCILGKGLEEKLPPRNPRFAFEEVCKVL
jgi:3-hydroxypropanoate dehydrogenase